jgi:hypothetical protein
MTFSAVDLPDPDGPSTAVTLLSGTVSDTWSSARVPSG